MYRRARYSTWRVLLLYLFGLQLLVYIIQPMLCMIQIPLVGFIHMVDITVA